VPASHFIKKAFRRLGLRNVVRTASHSTPKQDRGLVRSASPENARLSVSTDNRSQSTFGTVPLAELIGIWRSPENKLPIFIAVGGARKYDSSGLRTRWGMKEYQSTQPVTGVVEMALALHLQRPDLFKGAYPDYDAALKSKEARTCDLIVVGGGDTNVIANALHRHHDQEMPFRMNASNSSDTIVDKTGKSYRSDPHDGLILATENPNLLDLGIVARYLVLCAGLGAPGTNNALFLLGALLDGSQSLGLDLSQPYLLV